MNICPADFKTIVGLEIHVELKTCSKMFCRCSADHYRIKQNSNCCPVCLGLPGALPMPNKQAIEWTIMAGLALGCQILPFCKFDRKNYFYPDLPKGFQISQYNLPLAKNGFLDHIRIRRVHLEEDTAKLIHEQNQTYIDFNRSGVPLMEIVTEPDIHSSADAKAFLKKLIQIISYLGISDCDMEKGSLRLEANISVRKNTKENANKLPNYKVEIKNLNSFRFVQKAIDFESQRQIKLILAGKQPIQETRGWDEKRQITFTQRVKEEAQDYRYFPEPDLPPIRWKQKEIERYKKLIPELPEKKIERFISQFNLLKSQAERLCVTLQAANYFEKVVKAMTTKQPTYSQVANNIINQPILMNKYTPEQFVKQILKTQDNKQVSESELIKIITEIIKNNNKAVVDYKGGKKAAVEFLLGQVMRRILGRASPEQARRRIVQELENLS